MYQIGVAHFAFDLTSFVVTAIEDAGAKALLVTRPEPCRGHRVCAVGGPYATAVSGLWLLFAFGDTDGL